MDDLCLCSCLAISTDDTPSSFQARMHTFSSIFYIPSSCFFPLCAIFYDRRYGRFGLMFWSSILDNWYNTERYDRWDKDVLHRWTAYRCTAPPPPTYIRWRGKKRHQSSVPKIHVDVLSLADTVYSYLGIRRPWFGSRSGPCKPTCSTGMSLATRYQCCSPPAWKKQLQRWSRTSTRHLRTYIGFSRSRTSCRMRLWPSWPTRELQRWPTSAGDPHTSWTKSLYEAGQSRHGASCSGNKHFSWNNDRWLF